MFLKSSFGRNFLEVGNGLPIQMNSQIMVNIWHQSSKFTPTTMESSSDLSYLQPISSPSSEFHRPWGRAQNGREENLTWAPREDRPHHLSCWRGSSGFSRRWWEITEASQQWPLPPWGIWVVQFWKTGQFITNGPLKVMIDWNDSLTSYKRRKLTFIEHLLCCGDCQPLSIS